MAQGQAEGQARQGDRQVDRPVFEAQLLFCHGQGSSDLMKDTFGHSQRRQLDNREQSKYSETSACPWRHNYEEQGPVNKTGPR